MSEIQVSAAVDGERNQKIPLYADYTGDGPAKYQMPTGLGTKEHDPRKNQAPSYSFGMKHKEDSICAPSPSQYFYRDTLTAKGKQDAPSAPLGPKGYNKGIEVTPGPLDYSREKTKHGILSHERSSTSISMAPAYNLPDYRTKVAPNAYKLTAPFGVQTQTFKKSRFPSISGKPKSGHGSIYYQKFKENYPAPNTVNCGHSASRTSRSMPSYSLSKRYHVPAYNSQLAVPGPGSYEVPTHFNAKQGFSMGTKHSSYALLPISAVDLLH